MASPTKNRPPRAPRGPGGPSLPRVEADYRTLAGLEEQALVLAREEEDHRAALVALEARVLELHGRIKEARRALASSIIEADGRAVPSIDAWYHRVRPAWQVRSAGRVFALVADHTDGPPDGLADAADKVALAIIDLDEEEADPR